MKFKIVAGSVLSFLYVFGGEFLATNIVSETVLIKSPVIMGEPYNDAFTSLLRLGGMDEDAEIYRHNGAFDFNRHVGLFAHFEVREFKPKVPIFEMRQFRSGQVESVKLTVVTNMMSFAEAVTCLHEVRDLFNNQHVNITFLEQQKGCGEYEVRSCRPGKEGWNILMTAKQLDGGAISIELLINRSMHLKRNNIKDVHVDVDI